LEISDLRGLASDEPLGPPTTRGLVTTNAMGAKVGNHRGGKTTTGIIRNLDELGRIVIPIEIRKRFGLTERDPLEISVRDQTILLSRPRTTCVFCGTTRSVGEHRGRGVCTTCVAELTAS
jgi:AbrB family transcriptional regulator, transcriptional pleiotropic regulator of transition state genes